MPKQEPLPPPPQVDDQLSDSDEMQRVLEEHLLQSGAPVAEPSADAGETEEPLFRDDRQALDYAKQIAENIFVGEKYDFRLDPIVTAAKFSDLFKDKSADQISTFLQEFLKIYPNSEALTSYINGLQAIPMLKPARDSNEYRTKLVKITELLKVYISSLSQYGFDGDSTEIKCINQVDFLDKFVDDDEWIQVERSAITSITEASVKKVGLSADKVAKSMAAAIILKNQNTVSTYPKSVKKTDGTFIDDALANYARYEVSGIIAAENLERDNPFVSVMQIVETGGIFFGYCLDRSDGKNKLVFYLPYF